MHYFHPLWIASNAPNPFPPVNTQRLHASAGKMLEVIRQSQLLLNRIENSSDFARDLMDAAQLSNQKKVDELILSTGITIKAATTFTPSGIRIELNNADNSRECCKLQIALQW